MSAYLGALAAFTASVTWAFASTQYAAVAKAHGGARVALARGVAASALWLTWLAATDGLGSLAQIDLPRALVLLGSILCSYVLGDRVFFVAAARIGVSSALAIATIYPLWAALFGTFVRGEALGARRSCGIVCCLAGVSAVLWLSRSREPTERRAVWSGAALALSTSLFWAGNAVFLKQGTDGLTIYQANGFRYALGALLLAVMLPFTRGPADELPTRDFLRQLRAPLILDTGLGSLCFVYGIAHTDLALGATLSSLSPLVALPIAVALGSERVTAGKVGAVCLTLFGVVLLVTTA
jgi:drug/metabolite transporter (DMT)-like permease